MIYLDVLLVGNLLLLGVHDLVEYSLLNAIKHYKENISYRRFLLNLSKKNILCSFIAKVASGVGRPEVIVEVFKPMQFN